MRHAILLLFIGLFTFSTSAETIETFVHSIDNKYRFIKFNNGQVGYFNHSVDLNSGDKVIVELDSKNYITSAKKLKSYQNLPTVKNTFLRTERPEYNPTVLPDLIAAQKLHDSLNPHFIRKSECTDRAHVWVYEMFKNQKINSRKAFIFFTASYINRVKFKWWFHVAPMVDVMEGGQVQQKILDFMLIDRPVSVQEWTNLQVYSKRACKVTTKFSEYDVNPQTEDCYLIYETMYYRLPGDIYAQETRNEYKNSFNESEVNFAKKMGFHSQVNRSAL